MAMSCCSVFRPVSGSTHSTEGSPSRTTCCPGKSDTPSKNLPAALAARICKGEEGEAAGEQVREMCQRPCGKKAGPQGETAGRGWRREQEEEMLVLIGQQVEGEGNRGEREGWPGSPPPPELPDTI